MEDVKFTWSYRYVEDGQLKPDNHRRWAIDCYVHVNVKKALKHYQSFFPIKQRRKIIPIKIATICQKGCLPDSRPLLVDRFYVSMPTFKESANIGFSKNYNFSSDDIEELKKIVEDNYSEIITVFKNLE